VILRSNVYGCAIRSREKMARPASTLTPRDQLSRGVARLLWVQGLAAGLRLYEDLSLRPGGPVTTPGAVVGA
jgi:hypothetical protein